MRVTFLHKDGGSNVGDCAALLATDSAPSAYQLGDRPGYIVNGVALTADEEATARAAADVAGVGFADHEVLAWVPRDVIDRQTAKST